MPASRSTLLSRLEGELVDLDQRIQNSRTKTENLETEKSALKNVIETIRKSIKKTSHSVAEMPNRRSANATA